MNIDLDIIIPCFNCKNTLFDTLSSITIQQKVQGFKVYLVNDKSDYNYQDEVNYFSKFYSIEEITLKDNLGPGGARREGLKHSKSKYVMFIDSDDVLYDVLSIANLYEGIQGHDMCVSFFILQRDGVSIVKKNDVVWLHGKMYRREFLDKHNITFNDSRANEDNGFNRLILLLDADVKMINKITYLYRDNRESITRQNNRGYKITGLEGFVYNMIWAMKEALKRGADDSFIPYLASGVLISMYYDYLCYIDDENSHLIIKYCTDLLPYYKEYPRISDKMFNKMCSDKENVLAAEEKEYTKSISFEEFIRKVEEYD